MGRAGREGLPRREHPGGVRRRRARDDRAGGGRRGARRAPAARCCCSSSRPRSRARSSRATARDEQKERWLRGIGAGTTKIAFAVTEPDAGTNTHNISTRAERRRRGRLRIRGQKIYISGVEDAEALMVVHDSMDRRRRLPVHRRHRRAGARRGPRSRPPRRAPTSSGSCSSTTSRSARTGAWRNGLGALFDGLNPERIMAAALAVGAGRLRAGEGLAVRARAQGVVGADRRAPGPQPPARAVQDRAGAGGADAAQGRGALRRGLQGRRRGVEHGEVRGRRGGDPLRRPGDPDATAATASPRSTGCRTCGGACGRCGSRRSAAR